MKNRPNVVVIVSDTFRPDHLSINGKGFARTPELDALVRRGIQFDRATVSSFPTIPMRTDWFTGRFSHPRHGWKDLDRSAITLPGILRENGYTTQLLADTTHMLRAKFWEPFHHFQFLRGHEGDVPFSRLNDPIRPVVKDRRKTRIEFGNKGGRPAIVDVHAHTNFRQRYEDEAHCALLADLGCRWIQDNYRGGPFLLWMDCFDVHEPWFPPQYLLDSYHPGYDGEPMPHPNYRSAEFYEPEELKDLQARYASMCTLLSKQVGRVLRVMEDAGLCENTIVVFLSDHGTFLGEHGLTGKSLIHDQAFDVYPFHPEVSRFCWIMAIPESLGRHGAKPGSRFSWLAQAPDLLPTILDLCGIRPPENAEIEGQSLVPLLSGQTERGPREIAMTAWSVKTHHSDEFLYCRRPAVTDGEWTLILNEPPAPEAPLLYHTASDPGHATNLLAAHRDEAVRLHRAMLDFLRAHSVDERTLARLSEQSVGLG